MIRLPGTFSPVSSITLIIDLLIGARQLPKRAPEKAHFWLFAPRCGAKKVRLNLGGRWMHTRKKYQAPLVYLWDLLISPSEKLREAETWYSFYGLVLDYDQWTSDQNQRCSKRFFFSIRTTSPQMINLHQLYHFLHLIHRDSGSYWTCASEHSSSLP